MNEGQSIAYELRDHKVKKEEVSFSDDASIDNDTDERYLGQSGLPQSGKSNERSGGGPSRSNMFKQSHVESDQTFYQEVNVDTSSGGGNKKNTTAAAGVVKHQVTKVSATPLLLGGIGKATVTQQSSFMSRNTKANNMDSVTSGLTRKFTTNDQASIFKTVSQSGFASLGDHT